MVMLWQPASAMPQPQGDVRGLLHLEMFFRLFSCNFSMIGNPKALAGGEGVSPVVLT